MTLRIILILACLSAFGPLAIDLYLPAFSLIATNFKVSSDDVQLSLSVYLIGLSAGQLLYGPLTDKLGRRFPVIFGISLFIIASLGCALASTLNQLIALRFLQALGACAGIVVSRAVVRDLCDPSTSVKVFSQLMLVNSLTPLLSPLLGSLLLKYFPWYASFYLCFSFAILCLIIVSLWLPETIPANSPRPPINTAFEQYLHLFKEYKFLGFSLISGFAMAELFIYIGNSHFFFVETYGLSNTTYALIFAFNSLAYMLSAQINNFLLAKHDSVYWIKPILGISVTATLVLVAMSYVIVPVWLFIIPITIIMGSLGVLLPNLTGCAMALAGRQAGSASALMGCLQFGVAATLSGLTASLNTGALYSPSIMLVICGLTGLILAHFTLKIK